MENTFSLLSQDQIQSIVTQAIDAALKEHLNKTSTPVVNSGYISRKQVCSLLGITLPTVHAYVNKGILKSYHIGGRTLFVEKEVLDAVKPIQYNN